jgi:hypothetical protein
VCNLGFSRHEWASLKLECNESFNGSRVPKKAQITLERVEYNVFLFDEPLKGSKSVKIFKITLTFRFDKLSNLSKSVHTGENSQILTVSNKNKKVIISYLFFDFIIHFDYVFMEKPVSKFSPYQTLKDKTYSRLLWKKCITTNRLRFFKTLRKNQHKTTLFTVTHRN